MGLGTPQQGANGYDDSNSTIHYKNDRDLGQKKKKKAVITVNLQTIEMTANSRDSNNLFEGDIIPEAHSIGQKYGPEMVDKLKATGQIVEGSEVVKMGRNANLGYRWDTRGSDDLVHIPYAFAASSFTSTEITKITDALDELEQLAKVVKFDLRTTEIEYIRVVKGSGCSSYVGKVMQFFATDYQDLSLAAGCILSKGVIQHEFLHALGFWHEQSRSDRDTYVKINFENIITGVENNFEKATEDDTTNMGSP